MFKNILSIVVLLTFASAISAQALPYSSGNPDKFLIQSSSLGRPAIVLFNFNLSSG